MEDDDCCANCGSNILTLYPAPNEKEYCIECMRRRFPPYMIFLKYKKGNMYNVETGKYESIDDPKDLEMCGWDVKMIQTLPNETDVVYMEFNGDVRCGRCDDYEWFLEGGYCMSQACMNHKEKRPAQFIYYPAYKSFYLEWKYNNKI